MIDDEYLDDPKMRKFGRLSREMQREWRPADNPLDRIPSPEVPDIKRVPLPNEKKK